MSAASCALSVLALSCAVSAPRTPEAPGSALRAQPAREGASAFVLAAPEPPRAQADDSEDRLPSGLIQDTIRARRMQMHACYEAALQRDPLAGGKVVVKFTIQPSGQVSDVSSTASTTLGDATAVECVVTLFRSLEFPKPSGGDVKVLYPISFSAE